VAEDKNTLEEQQEAAEELDIGQLVDSGDIGTLAELCEEELAKANRYLANWQRAQADYINYKKRVEQESSEYVKTANLILIQELLPILDDFERAFNSLPSDLVGLTWLDGIILVQRKLVASLEAHGVSEISALGETFDPSLHEAVTQAEGEEGKVLEVLQKGYKLYERVIRPTMVVVGMGEVHS